MVKLVALLLVVTGIAVATKLASGFIERMGRRKALSRVRVLYVRRVTELALLLLGLIVSILVLGWEYPQIYVFLSSIFAILGVALFAQWSILSNLTASLMIFFGFPYRVGDRVRVVEKDDDISGIIEEIAAFHVLIRRENGDLITYPNSMILQKPVIKIAAKSTSETDKNSPASEQ